jgi:hypothetical protein
MDDKDYSSSRVAFGWAVLWGHARLWIIALFSAVFLADNLAEKFIKPRVSREIWKKNWEWLTAIGSGPIYLWGIVVALILLVGTIESSFRLYRASRRREDLAVSRVREYETPRLELSWIPTESPYRWWDHTQKPPALYFGFGVKNISGVRIDGIKVELQKVEPEPNSSYVPCPLRLRHNILPQNDPIREFSLNCKETQFVQLMIQSESLDVFWMLTAIARLVDPDTAVSFSGASLFSSAGFGSLRRIRTLPRRDPLEHEGDSIVRFWRRIERRAHKLRCRSRRVPNSKTSTDSWVCQVSFSEWSVRSVFLRQGPKRRSVTESRY